MFARHRILIGIEKTELRFWKLTRKLLKRGAARSSASGSRLDRGLWAALVWAEDAVRSRREELSLLRARARLLEHTAASRSNPATPTSEPTPRLAA